jgi:tape measure domain-containing protein
VSSVDERVVQMTFKSADFLKASADVLNALANLKDKLSGLKGAEGALNNIDAAGRKMNLSGIASGVDQIASKFSMLGVIGVSALATIASKAVAAGLQLAKSFTVAPIMAGLHEYETQLTSIQTILANTGLEGQAGLDKVNAALNELNHYADLTIYNFEQMAANIGRFTAAGVGLETSVASIKGLSNLAAMSGSSAEQASVAMYQLSQAIASGTIRLMDWNSIVNAGMGGKVFQNALIQTARVHGVAVDDMIKKNGSFRDSLQEGWLSADIMTETLSTFTGDLSAAQLKAMGYTDAQTQAIMKQAKLAQDAATKVKTVTQLISTVGEAVQSAWAAVWQALIGDLGQATTLLTSVNNVMSNMFTKPVQNLADLLTEWGKLGGRTLLIDALSDAFRKLGSILTTIGKAFRDVFPATTAQNLYDLTARFHDFIDSIKIGSQTLQNLHKIFEGLFSAVKIVWDVIKGAAGVIGDLVAAAFGASGGFLDLGARIGDFLSNIRKTIESGTGLTRFFDILSTVLTAPVKLLGLLGEGLSKLADSIGPIVSRIAGAFKAVGTAIYDAFKSGDLTSVASLINEGLFGAILVAVGTFMRNLAKRVGGAGMLSSLKQSFQTLTNTLRAMQMNLNADTLMKIAIAVGVLAVSLVALSFIDPGKLAKSLTAITVMFTEMLGAMAIVSKIASSGGFIKMAVVAAALNLLATSILILSAAVAVLSMFSWEQLAKGIGAVAVLLGVLVAAVNLMPSKGLLSAALAMTAMAVAIDILTAAVGILGSMNISTLVKGLVSVAAALGIIILAMRLMPKNMIVTAAGLLVVSAALTILAGAMAIMGNMSWGEIGKSLTELAAGLVIIAAAMILMSGTLAGAAALLVVAGALALLTPVLVTLGAMPWSVLLTSLGALAAVFVVLGAAGLLLTPVAPALLAIGAAMALFGVGMLAVGTGMVLLGTGLTLLGAALTVSGAAIVAFVTSILNLIPLAMQKIGEGIVMMATEIGKGGVAITTAFVAILNALLDAIIQVIPKAVDAIVKLIWALLTALDNNVSRFVGKGMDIIVKFLNGIAAKVQDIIAAGTNIIINVIKGIGNAGVQIANAAADTLVKFLNGLTAAINSHSGQINAAARSLIGSIVGAIGSAMDSMTGGLFSKAKSIGASIISFMTAPFRGSPIEQGPMKDFGIAILKGVENGLADNKSLLASAEKTSMMLLATLSQMGNDIDVQPVITPVIDLSQAKKGFDDLAAMSRIQPVTTAAMAAIAAASVPGVSPSAEAVPVIAGPVYNFTQNNTSPKALSESEIYRQTKNQLSVMKGALP